VIFLVHGRILTPRISPLFSLAPQDFVFGRPRQTRTKDHKQEDPMSDTTPPADCWTVATQEELDEAFAAQGTDPNVCIHVAGNAEPAVLAWQAANRVEPEIAGEW
jgi:hypothetical protein